MKNNKINDGIYHPYYNENGWRRIKKSDGAMIYWYDDTDHLIGSVEDCFKVELINSDDDVSGRTDEKIMANVVTIGIDDYDPNVEYPENTIIMVYGEDSDIS